MRWVPLTVLTCIFFGACSGGAPKGSPNGFWAGPDGGQPGLVVFRVGDHDEWSAQGLFFDEIALRLSTACAAFDVSPDGVVSRDGGESPFVVTGSDPAWALALELSPSIIDAQYRRVHPNDAGAIDGTVSASFDGGLSGDAFDELRFDYEMVYRDAVKVLGNEGGSHTLKRASVCP